MVYTTLQQLRRARALDKGNNFRLAASLRLMADMFEKKGTEEFSRDEIKDIQRLREMLTLRLKSNALTKAMRLLQEGNYKKVNGQYRIELKPKDL